MRALLAVEETCKALKVGEDLARLMRSYHERALRDPKLAPQPFQSANEVIGRSGV